MFRCSIREIMVLTLAAIMGVAWFAEHRQWLAASVEATEVKEECKIANGKADDLERENNRLRDYIIGIDQQLVKNKLHLVFVCGGGRKSFIEVSPLSPYQQQLGVSIYLPPPLAKNPPKP